MNARRAALGYLWAHHRAAVIAMVLALGVALFFAVRLTVFTIYWADPAHRDQPIEGWMTPGYVARSHDVDQAVIRAALPDLPAAGTPARQTLAQIAADADIPLPMLIAALTAAIAAARAP